MFKNQSNNSLIAQGLWLKIKPQTHLISLIVL